MTTQQKARNFINRFARPIDLARWKFHFEGGTKDDVADALAAYQNEDGGFGHGLEADLFNPHSSPIQTCHAIEMLREIGYLEASHPIILGMLRYLDSGADFDEQHAQWLNVLPTNNDYPHAVWWHYGENGSEFKYNPTAALAGFLLRYAPQDTPLYARACQIARAAYEWFMAQPPFIETHVTLCLMHLYEDCLGSHAALLDMHAFASKLSEQIDLNICKDTRAWSREYVAFPSTYLRSRNSVFCRGHEELIAQECRFIRENQQADGAFPVLWKWWTDYKEFALSVKWWQSDFCIRNLLFLREFEGLSTKA